VSRDGLEELANSVTHGIGLLLSLAGLPVLVTLAALRGNAWTVVSCSVFGSSLVLLYLASTLYHSFQGPRVKHTLRVIDHSAIFILIAGTYTPFTLVSLRGPWGWSLFGVEWGLALTGIVAKYFVVHRFAIASTMIYIMMGWIIVIAVKPVLAAIPPEGIAFLFMGGVAYTLGTIFFAWHKLPLNHAIWHLFVLAGSIFHFFAVLVTVIPAKA
jgi:hemolysin III